MIHGTEQSALYYGLVRWKKKTNEGWESRRKGLGERESLFQKIMFRGMIENTFSQLDEVHANADNEWFGDWYNNYLLIKFLSGT